MNRTEKKAIIAAARAMREAALNAGDIAAANTLDSLFRQYKMGSVNIVEYGQRLNTLYKVESAYNREADKAAKLQNKADTNTTLANTAFSRKVSPAQRDGYQTIRDENGNIKTVRPKASEIRTGSEVQKARRIERQRAERAERQRIAERQRAEAERQHITEAVSERAAQRAEAAKLTPEAAAAADKEYAARIDRDRQRVYVTASTTLDRYTVGHDATPAAFTEADYTERQRAAAAAARNASAQRAAARAK